MITLCVALVSETDKVSRSELDRVAAALQKQVTRDFSPIWNISATVSPFASLKEVPVGYWRMIVREKDFGPVFGFHHDAYGRPWALVCYHTTWSLTASHECLEMLADPSGNRLVAGPSKRGSGTVEYLVEVCDACQLAAYYIDGILVSDFLTPEYFSPSVVSGGRYTYLGSIRHPWDVSPGGYLSWVDPATEHLWQQTKVGRTRFVDLGAVRSTQGLQSLRAIVDAMTPVPLLARGLPRHDRHVIAARRISTTLAKAGEKLTAGLHAQIEELNAGTRRTRAPKKR